jgi:tRNA/tmRNA/rRNA uracil-C5-methylase (TrmA/RlmC/RlmD family)
MSQRMLDRRRQPVRRVRVAPRATRPARITSADSFLRVGTDVETTIERIVPGGFGLAFAGGRTLFVSRAAPGDRVRVRVDREHGRTAHASIVEILEPGPDRIAEPYPLLTRCGADFQHLRYDAQLRAKSEMIADCLRRIGGIELSEPVPVAPSPVAWGYRGRVEWRHDPSTMALGYLETGSKRVVDLPQDPFVVPALAERFAHLRARLMAGTLPEWATELRAAEFAQRNLAAAGLTRAKIETASIERWLEGAYRSHGRAPFVLIDPPRTGLPGLGLRFLPRLRAERIAYVSCDPATLARDLKALRASEYEVIALATFDMFPQTHHVEIVAHLQRTG